jgi:DNA-binding CsgD family transcriptional regulator
MLLAKYFGRESDHRLPRVLLRWLQGYSTGHGLRTPPWITEIGEQQLSVRITGREDGCFQLLLEEKTNTSSPNRLETLGLTPREAEVLHWIMRGKTNSDIATILKCETATVMKHAERIFSKLHVETRTAAAAMAFEVMI